MLLKCMHEAMAIPLPLTILAQKMGRSILGMIEAETIDIEMA